MGFGNSNSIAYICNDIQPNRHRTTTLILERLLYISLGELRFACTYLRRCKGVVALDGVQDKCTLFLFHQNTKCYEKTIHNPTLCNAHTLRLCTIGM